MSDAAYAVRAHKRSSAAPSQDVDSAAQPHRQSPDMRDASFPASARQDSEELIDLQLQHASEAAHEASSQAPANLVTAASLAVARAKRALDTASSELPARLEPGTTLALDGLYAQLTGLAHQLKDSGDPVAPTYAPMVVAVLMELKARFEGHGWKAPKSLREVDARGAKAGRSGLLSLSGGEAEQLGGMVVDTMVGRVERHVAAVKDTPAGLRATTIPVASVAIATELHATIATLSDSLAERLPALHAEVYRLDRALTHLFQMARLSNVRMRGVQLERVFDLEDAFRLAVGLERRGRAQIYYDANEGQLSAHTDASETSAEAAAAHLKDGAGAASDGANTRRSLITDIVTAHKRFEAAIGFGERMASDAINEPPPAEKPELLEELLKVALGFVQLGAYSALGKLISAGLKNLKASEFIAGLATSEVRDALVDAFTDSSKAAITGVRSALDEKTQSPTQQTATHGPHMVDAMERVASSNPKKQFLQHVAKLTSDAMIAAGGRLAKFIPELERMPIESLRQLSGALASPGMHAQVSVEFSNMLIREWVEFVRCASNAGVMNPRKSRLDSILQPQGVICIEMAIDAKLNSLTDMSLNRVNSTTVRSASLAGVDKAVIEKLAQQDLTLGTVPLQRKVVLSMSDQVPDVTFDVSRDQKVTPPRSLSSVQYGLLAKGAGVEGPLLQREFYSGKEALGLFELILAQLDKASLGLLGGGS